jgi:hypothetical protein
MSTFIRKLVFGFIGLLGGLAAWPLSEVLLIYQSGFPTLLIFTISLGGVFGAMMGAFLGSSEGITLSIRGKIGPGMITGALVGILGGVVGFLIGQGVLLFISELVFHSNRSLRAVGIPVSRVISWTFLGMFIGTVEGIRAFSWSKIKVGVFGGIMGGVLGGITMEALTTFFPGLVFSRLAGLMVFGFLIGICYGLFEKSMSNGVLRLLNGKLKGKEYLLVQRKIKVGQSAEADIQLPGYKDVAEIHAILKVRKDTVQISKSTDRHRILVNEIKVNEHLLKFEDVVQIGSAKFLFFYK